MGNEGNYDSFSIMSDDLYVYVSGGKARTDYRIWF